MGAGEWQQPVLRSSWALRARVFRFSFSLRAAFASTDSSSAGASPCNRTSLIMNEQYTPQCHSTPSQPTFILIANTMNNSN